MYHYTTVVSHTMSGCNHRTQETWQQTIPQLSFESEVVLHPMLALSALHLHAHSHSEPEMAIVLGRYVDQSLVGLRQALSISPGGESSEQLWLAVVLLSHIYWPLAHQANEAYELPLEAFKMLEGLSSLTGQKRALLDQLGYTWLGYTFTPHVAPPNRDLPKTTQRQLHNLEEDLTCLLDAFDLTALPEHEKNIYMDVRDYVLQCCRALLSGAESKIFQWFIGFVAGSCQKAYRQKLEQHDPLAMALMARMLVLLSGQEYVWWIHGKGAYEVLERDVRGICELMPENLRWTMDWPCKVLNGGIILNSGLSTQ